MSAAGSGGSGAGLALPRAPLTQPPCSAPRFCPKMRVVVVTLALLFLTGRSKGGQRGRGRGWGSRACCKRCGEHPAAQL